MGLLGRASGRETTYVECRRCGTTVDEGTDVCPTCGSTDIVEYRFDE